MNGGFDSGYVLAAVDGTDADNAAIQWGVTEAVHRGLPLRLVHVFEAVDADADLSPDLTGEVMASHARATRQVIDTARRAAYRCDPDVRVEHRVRLGSVVPALLAEAMDATVAVLGSGRRADPTHARLGSVAVHVTTHATCPVVVARTPLEGEPVTGPGTGKIVVGTDGSTVSHEAVGFAFEEASWRGLDLTAVHAWQPEPGSDPRLRVREEREAQRQLGGSVAPWRDKYPDVFVVERVVDDHPVRALLEESRGAKLLVVGCHGRGRFAGMLLGSVSQALLRHASASVAVVRPHGYHGS